VPLIWWASGGISDAAELRRLLIGKPPDRASYPISGQVYALDEKTVFIKNLNCDSQAPDANFWSGPGVKELCNQHVCSDGQ